jgi:preprotein translocase subunit SecY
LGFTPVTVGLSFAGVWAVVAGVFGVVVVVVVVLGVVVVVVEVGESAITGTAEIANKVRITMDKTPINTNLRDNLPVIFASCL